MLAWGALNACTQPRVPQVRFRYDYAGGWGKYRRAVWKRFAQRVQALRRPAARPPRRRRARRRTARTGRSRRGSAGCRCSGFEPWLPEQSAWELHLSHWTGPLAQLDVSPNWTYGGQWVGLFGRLTYLGEPVHGLATTSGNPRDRYGRNVYIDTYNSAYGPGWKRESGIVTHRPTGTFCHSFVPQRPFPGYPSNATRPAAPGSGCGSPYGARRDAGDPVGRRGLGRYDPGGTR